MGKMSIGNDPRGKVLTKVENTTVKNAIEKTLQTHAETFKKLAEIEKNEIQAMRFDMPAPQVNNYHTTTVEVQKTRDSRLRGAFKGAKSRIREALDLHSDHLMGVDRNMAEIARNVGKLQADLDLNVAQLKFELSKKPQEVQVVKEEHHHHTVETQTVVEKANNKLIWAAMVALTALNFALHFIK